MTSLLTSKGTNKFCGPAVLSSITGISTDEAEKILQDIIGTDKNIKGVWDADLVKAFTKLGYNVTYLRHIRGSLFYVLTVLSAGIYVIVVPGHYICIEIDTDGRRYLADTYRRTPFTAAASARLGQKVLMIMKVEKA